VDAQGHLHTVESSKLMLSYVDPAAGRVTFHQYAEEWRAVQPHRRTTADSTEILLRRHAYPTFGERRMATIRPSEIQAWVQICSSELAASTVATVVQKVKAVFRAAVVDRIIGLSPCDGVKLPRTSKPQVVPMTAGQVFAVAEHMQDRYSALVTVGASTGLRVGELLGLGVDQVDWLRRTIRVERQMVVATKGLPARLGPLKTESSARTIPAASTTLDSLSAHLAAYAAGQWGLIFTADDGGPLSRSTARDAWRGAARRAGVVGFTFHDLRHFAASVLIDEGASVKVVQEFLGHKNAAETLDTYSHLWPSSDDLVRAALDKALVSPVCHEGSLRAANLR
jgi:integrase